MFGGPPLHRLAELHLAQQRRDVALGQPIQLQRDGGQIDRVQRHRRRLPARQHEQPRVERDRRRPVRHGEPKGGLLQERKPVLAGQAGAQHDADGHAGQQAGDAELVVLARHRDARLRRLEPHPVLRVEVRPAHRGHRKRNAGAGRIGLGLGGQFPHRDPGGFARLGQKLLDRGVVGRHFVGVFQREHRVRQPVEGAQRLRDQQQRRRLLRPFVGRGVGVPGGGDGLFRVRRRAVEQRSCQIEPLLRRLLALGDAGFECGRERRGIVLRGGGGDLVVRGFSRRRVAAGGGALVQIGGVALRVDPQARRVEIVGTDGQGGKEDKQ